MTRYTLPSCLLVTRCWQPWFRYKATWGNKEDTPQTIIHTTLNHDVILRVGGMTNLLYKIDNVANTYCILCTRSIIVSEQLQKQDPLLLYIYQTIPAILFSIIVACKKKKKTSKKWPENQQAITALTEAAQRLYVSTIATVTNENTHTSKIGYFSGKGLLLTV